ncbi:aldehyde dehydrogenase family protein [uncultured Jannaschia sp.]|uniref:aldehyde dehydrogenase family protein n=1 Tax=uncultured Jannaschia sp. TaxID=293347 RepID=UPI00260BBFF0|nr:aldehyde dehydrogenase family protein [uncultured Jannaschia sp.]
MTATVITAHARLRRAFSLEDVPPVAARIARLKQLGDALRDRRSDLIAAIDADFGPRAESETMTAELAFLRTGLKHTIRHLPRWSRPRTARVLQPVPGRTDIWTEPKGVVGILSPWNYPLQLALMPLISAVAAGNRVLLKPSERSPATTAALASLLEAVFPPDELAVVTGGPDVAQAVAALPLGHLFFTGSTETGRKVAQAAARTLTPVTLELGGRSPAVALPDASPEDHAPIIAWGAWLSAGQTCVAPNHLWVPRDSAPAWTDALLDAARGFLPDDYTAMIDARAFSRMERMIAEAREGGALVRVTEGEVRGRRTIAPTIVVDPPPDSALMTEEIFGPVLVVLTYRDPEEVIVAEADASPLAAYVFDRDAARARRFLTRLRSGGGAVNATVLHLAAHDLPFGGIGESGYGAYHGHRGFREFSHERAVFTAARGPWLRMLLPPYSETARRLFRRMTQ